MEGWIKLHRKLIDSDIFKNEKGLKVWIWCLIRANHSDHSTLLGRTKVVIRKGSFIMGSHTAKESLDMAISTLWYWLRFLETEGMVEIKNTNKYSVIKLKNWDKFQVVENKSESNQQANGKQTETDKNVKNVENEKNLSERKLIDPKTGKKPTTASGWTRAKRVSLGKEPNMEKKEIPSELLELDLWIKDHRTMAERNGEDYTFLDDGDNKRMRGQIGKFIPKWYNLGKTREEFFKKLEANEWAKTKGFNPFLVYTEAMMTSLLIGGKEKGGVLIV